MATPIGVRPRPRCIHSGRLAILTSECRWPRGTILSWYVDPSSRFGNLTPDQTGQAISAGIEPWSQNSGAIFRRVFSPDQARVLISSRPIDRLNGILAQTELPCEGRADVQHTMIFDSAEPWTPRFLFQVALHETGHALGVGHSPEGIKSAMSAFYDPTIETLQPWEIARAVERYGPPAVTPTPEVVEQSIAVQPFDVKLTIDQPGEYLLQVTPTFNLKLTRK